MKNMVFVCDCVRASGVCVCVCSFGMRRESG